MKVSDTMEMFEITGWRAALFWSVNIPRYYMGMDLVIYRCMIGCLVIKGFKRATIEVANK